MRYFTCFDIGGSSLKCAEISEQGILVRKASYPIAKKVSSLLGQMKDFHKEAKHSIHAIAISSCGAVDCKTGKIGGISAVPCIHGPSWKQLIEEEFGIPCEIENDANCAALSELYFGEAKSIQDMAFIVIGTGIGGAIVQQRKIIHGAHLYGGEFGMMLVKQDDGTVDNFSMFASTSSMVRKVCKKYEGTWDGKRIFEEAALGNEFCQQVIEEFYDAIAFGVFNVQHMLDPEMILFGGAISARTNFTDRIMASYKKLCSGLDCNPLYPKLACCSFRQDANILGALAHYLQCHKEEKEIV